MLRGPCWGNQGLGLLKGATAGFIIAWLDFFFSICFCLFYFFFPLKSFKPVAFLPLFIDLCKFCICNAFLIEFSILLFFFSITSCKTIKTIYTYFYPIFWHKHTKNSTLPSLPFTSGTYILNIRYLYIDQDKITEMIKKKSNQQEMKSPAWWKVNMFCWLNPFYACTNMNCRIRTIV